MNFKWFFFLIFINISYILNEIRFIFNIFTHGAKASPIKPDSNTDILGNTWHGNGELTPIGLRTEYLLGHRNRQKYADFLNTHYTPEEVYILASDVNRTITSALAHMDGLYPPTTGPVIDTNRTAIAVPPVYIANVTDITSELGVSAIGYDAQVFPVHTIPSDSHEFHLHKGFACRSVGRIIYHNRKKEKVSNFVQVYKDKYSAALIKALNLKDRQFDNFYIVNEISSAFVAGMIEGKDFKYLEDAGINLIAFNHTSYQSLKMEMLDINFGDESQFVGHMSMSPIHRSMIKWMDTRIDYDSKGIGYVPYKAPKMVLLSAHDADVYGMQVFLEYVFPLTVKGEKFVPFSASSLHYQLHRSSMAKGYNYTDYFVDIFHDDTILASINYDEFRSTILEKAYTQTWIDHYCGFGSSMFTENDIAMFVISAFLAATSLTLLIIMVIMCCQRREDIKRASYDNIMI
jgi:hypothetical protein